MRPTSDVTARARIRDAAVRRFAEQGARETTIRAVAEEAGVTPGLVCHHFGSKRGLRGACDAYVLEYLRDGISEAVDERRAADPEFLTREYPSGPVVLRYLARALVDGSATAAALFDDIVTRTEENLTRRPPRRRPSHADPRAQAAVHAAMQLGTWVLHDHLLRALEADTLTPEVFSRVSAALLDIMSADFVGSDLLLLAPFQPTQDS